MFNNTIFLGISGQAPTVGKDYFYSLLAKELPNCTVRLSFGDMLKYELASYLFKRYNIDIFLCTPEEKEKIRPELINYAENKRKESSGKYFWSLIDALIKTEYNSGDRFLDNKIAVITDIRFAEYKNDELWYLKEILGGKLVYVKKYTIEKGRRKFVSTNIKQELENAPKLEKSADLIISWEHGNIEQCTKIVKNSIKKLGLQKYERIRTNQ